MGNMQSVDDDRTSEVVALSLDEVRGQSFGAVAVEEGESRGVCRNGDTPQTEAGINQQKVMEQLDSRGLGNDSPPSGLSARDSLQEEWAGEEILELGVLAVGGGDVGKEDTLRGVSVAFVRRDLVYSP
jgi:hypothetical protein